MRRLLLLAALVLFPHVLLPVVAASAADNDPASITVQWGVSAFAEIKGDSASARQEMASVLTFLFISVRDSWNFLVADDDFCPVIEASEVADSYANILTAIRDAPELTTNGALDHDLVPILMIDIQGRMEQQGFDCPFF